MVVGMLLHILIVYLLVRKVLEQHHQAARRERTALSADTEVSHACSPYTPDAS
jgi:hypothetical protein